MKKALFIALVILASGAVLFSFGLAVMAPSEADIRARQEAERAAAATASALDKPTVSFGNPTLGPRDAKVTLIVFGDYQCEACARFEAAIKAVRDARPNDVRVVWKDMPNSAAHPEAINAAVAARCAADQGAFWPYHDLLMSQGGAVIPANYLPFAAQLKLDAESFRGCYDNAQTKPLVQRDFDEGQRLRITTTPTAFIGDRRIEGAVDAEQLKAFVEAALAR